MENKIDTRGRKRVLTGTVVSDKMDKTRVVQVQLSKKHPLYNKVMLFRSKYKAHDEKNAAKEGDQVRIRESRPISKDKRWVITEIVNK